MQQLTLVCAVYDVGSVFRVQIAREANVFALRKAIIEAQQQADVRFCGVNPAAVALYIARERENGAWLKDDADLDAFLQGPVSGLYKKMRLTYPLNCKKYFGENQEPPVSGLVHILVKLPPASTIVAERYSQSKVWVVSGSIPKAPKIEGLRQRLFGHARDAIGYYDPTLCNNGANTAFWYDNATLQLRVLFQREHDAISFRDEVEDEAKSLIVPPQMKPLAMRVDVLVLMEKLQHVLSAHYVPDKLAIWLDETDVSETDPRTDAFRHQRIEREHLFVPYGLAESCRLMPHSQCYQERVAIGDDANNQLALSRDMRGWFDGIACKVPIVNIRAGAVDVAPSVDSRYKVELLVSVLDEKCASRVFSRLKAGSVTTDDPLVMKTFVHVLDPATFVRCLRFKYEENEARWANFPGANQP